MRVWTKVLSAIIATALVAAACGTSSSSSSSGNGKFDGTIKLGANVELSGFDQAFGQSEADGMKIAIQDVNAAGGVKVGGKRYRLELVTKDNRSDATGAVQAAQELSAEHVLAATGPSNDFNAAYEIQKPDQIVFQGTPTAALLLQTALDNNRKLFSLIPFSTQVFINWLPQIKALFPNITKIGVLIEDEAIADPLVASIRAGAAPLGMEVVAVEKFPLDSTDFSTQLTRIREANPDIVFTGRVPVHNVPAMQQAAQLDVAPYLWAFTGKPDDLGNLKQFNGKTLIFSQFAPIVGKGVTIPALKGGEARLKRGLDKVVLPEVTIPTYNFVRLLAASIEKAGVVDDPAAIAKAMEGTSFTGPFGATRMDPAHFQDFATSQIVYRDGKTTVYVYNSILDAKPAEEIVTQQ
jgi:branched-chain amino acid transport system substrate-binding protein